MSNTRNTLKDKKQNHRIKSILIAAFTEASSMPGTVLNAPCGVIHPDNYTRQGRDERD